MTSIVLKLSKKQKKYRIINVNYTLFYTSQVAGKNILSENMHLRNCTKQIWLKKTRQRTNINDVRDIARIGEDEIVIFHGLARPHLQRDDTANETRLRTSIPDDAVSKQNEK